MYLFLGLLTMMQSATVDKAIAEHKFVAKNHQKPLHSDEDLVRALAEAEQEKPGD